MANGDIEFRITESGEGEYRKKGADTWIPFNKTVVIDTITDINTGNGGGYIILEVAKIKNLSFTLTGASSGSGYQSRIDLRNTELGQYSVDNVELLYENREYSYTHDQLTKMFTKGGMLFFFFKQNTSPAVIRNLTITFM